MMKNYNFMHYFTCAYTDNGEKGGEKEIRNLFSLFLEYFYQMC
jgi:hypothetical protein